MSELIAVFFFIKTNSYELHNQQNLPLRMNKHILDS